MSLSKRCWTKVVKKLDNRTLKYAQKEFAVFSMIACGLDGDQQTRKSVFRVVRGAYADNSFVSDVENDTAKKTKITDDLAVEIDKCC